MENMNIKKIDQAIAIAKCKVKDVSAQTYLQAIPRAIEEYGSDGFETQILYALANMASWRGEEARDVKAFMRQWLKTKKRTA
jgi:hypothetical protein